MAELEKHKVRSICSALQKTLGLKVMEYRDQRPDDAELVTAQASTLQKRLGKILDEEEWTDKQLLEMSTITFLMAVAASTATEKDEDGDDEAFEW